MANIVMKNMVKQYDKAETIRNVSLEIENGEFVVFVGPSGCGKSTLLRMIAGLESISGGELYIDDQLMNHRAPSERGVAMVFQSYALYPHLNVAENMGFGLKMNGVDKQEIARRVTIAAKTLQMESLLDRKPKDMSGGQRQRVAIGRAIVRNPKVFLFDEPLSNLNAELRVEMRLQIAKLHHELGNTMVYVTHDQVEAMTLADKIVVLRSGQIEQIGSPLTLYHAPANLFVAGFIGSPKMNFLEGRFRSYQQGKATIELADGQLITLPARDIGLAAASPVTIGIRPEHIALTGDSSHFRIRFQSEVVERLGNATYLFGNSLGTSGFKIHIAGDRSVKLYEELDLAIHPTDCHLFDPQGIAFGIREVPAGDALS